MHSRRASDQEETQASGLTVNLVDRARAGDRVALGDLLQQHGPKIRRILRGAIPKRWQALLSIDDVLQQTYLDAFLDIGDFAGSRPEAFEGWLSTMARRNLHDAIRMLSAEKRGGDRTRLTQAMSDESFVSLFELTGGTQSSPSRTARKGEIRTFIQDALYRLPPDYRQAVVLFELEGLGAERVAEVLNRSTGAVYMLRARALDRLASILGPASKYLSGQA